MWVLTTVNDALNIATGEFSRGNLNGFTQEETSIAMNALKQRESGGNYQANNGVGYFGAYQFGAEALARDWSIVKNMTHSKPRNVTLKAMTKMGSRNMVHECLRKEQTE